MLYITPYSIIISKFNFVLNKGENNDLILVVPDVPTIAPDVPTAAPPSRKGIT